MNPYNVPWRLVHNKSHHYPGGRELDRFRGVEPACDDNHPEAWVGSTIGLRYPAYEKEGYSRCIRPDSGEECYLADAVQEDREAMLGGAPDLAVPRRIVRVPEVPVLGSGKTDYVAIQRMAEMEAKAA